MTLIQAILLGGCYWMYVNEIGSGFNYAFFCYPSTACIWYGLILGDLKTALLCGGTIAPLFLGYAAVGAVVATDKAAATIIPTAAVICYGMDLNVALALSVPVGLLFAQMHTLRRTIGSWYIRRAEKIIENGCDGKRLYLNGVLLPSLVKVVLFWLPMTLICYFALQTFSGFMERIPAWLQSGLSAIGGVLPALGMGLLLNGMGEKAYLLKVLYYSYGSCFKNCSKCATAASSSSPSASNSTSVPGGTAKLHRPRMDFASTAFSS